MGIESCTTTMDYGTHLLTTVSQTYLVHQMDICPGVQNCTSEQSYTRRISKSRFRHLSLASIPIIIGHVRKHSSVETIVETSVSWCIRAMISNIRHPPWCLPYEFATYARGNEHEPRKQTGHATGIFQAFSGHRRPE